MTSKPTYSDLRRMHHAAEVERARLTAELQATRLDLWRARTIQRLPRIAPAIGLITGDTEEVISAHADQLAAALDEARTPSPARRPAPSTPA